MFNIRQATPKDTQQIYSLNMGLAAYENMTELVSATVKDLENILFEEKIGHCLVAEADGRLVGFALYYYNFSSFKCKKGIYLEDLFVLEEYRGQGIGNALLTSLCKIAKNENCGRFEWVCLDWNTPSLEFYKHRGASVIDSLKHVRVDETEFDKVIEG